MKAFFVRNHQYHFWATEVLYRSLDAFSEDDLKKDMGLFFRSIHGTINHLLLVEKLWFSRLVGEDFQPKTLSQELQYDPKALKMELFLAMKRWETWLESQTEDIWQKVFTYKTMRGFVSRLLYCDLIHHNMNHRTHHRGQISAAITALGGTTPEMDYVYFLQQTQYQNE
ncbi:DinB family protein [Leptospira ryugenii]|uniref:DinB family protein n=1 Tax=Leptospira ryugenii TaxID=1917863 RepID=A0A2P2E264_9LEPT|nr:DinB family protein [Leptospira ryugenii]GBF50993.1 DinB family protein [Leptospira ryugenii]